VPNAAYRHFANRAALLAAVRSAGLSALARAIEAALDAIHATSSEADYARAMLRAVGTGYLRFAIAEPGLFRTAFSVLGDPPGTPDPDKSGKQGLTPFQLLGQALDRMVAAGVLPAERRPGAEHLAWSAVHGFALLVIDGPLRALDPAGREAIGRRVLAMVEKGL
jgi:AcrR family transcriptional regulator